MLANWTSLNFTVLRARLLGCDLICQLAVERRKKNINGNSLNTVGTEANWISRKFHLLILFFYFLVFFYHCCRLQSPSATPVIGFKWRQRRVKMQLKECLLDHTLTQAVTSGSRLMSPHSLHMEQLGFTAWLTRRKMCHDCPRLATDSSLFCPLYHFVTYMWLGMKGSKFSNNINRTPKILKSDHLKCYFY